MKKRILSFVLALLMMVSTVPAPVFAADGGEAAPVAETGAAPTTETTAPTEPEETTTPTEPVETTVPTEPVETTAPTEPAETTAPTEPAETTAPTEPAETTAPTEPAETTAPTEPAETTALTEPAETTAPTEPAETTAPTEPPVEKPDIPAMFAMFAGRSTAEPQAEGDSECDCPSNHDPAEGHVATCPLYTCPRCGDHNCYGTCPVETDVGKYVKLTASTMYGYVADPNWSYVIVGSYPAFMEISEVLERDGVTYYRLKAAPDYSWPSSGGYSDDTVYLESTKLTFVTRCSCGEYDCINEHKQCDKCGEYDCTRLHFWCDRCNQYDCGKAHLICRACSEVDCTEKHVFCGYCNDYDCGKTHGAEPETAPVIPDAPAFTPNEKVSLADAKGNPISGVTLPAGTKTSLSAWTDLQGTVTYRWQVCYDREKDLWVNIQGQTGKGILMSPAMLLSVAQDNKALIRCVVTDGQQTRTGDAIPVALTAAGGNSSGNSASLQPLAEGDGTENLQKVNVIIEYVFTDGKIAANPRTATLPAGVAYAPADPVIIPNIPGYNPKIGESATDGNAVLNGYQLTLSFTAEEMQSDRTVRVVYEPAPVKVIIRHYQQNVDNDEYTLKESEEKSLTTGTVVGDVHKSYDGFYNLNYEKPTVAADGSTVLEIKYDRYYYLMKFDLGGGYGVDPIFARYGADIEIGTPVRAGYTFQGWTLDGADADVPSKMPAENRTYTAKWQVTDKAKVTVVFWGENPNDEEYSYLTTGVVNAKPGTDYTFADGNTVLLTCGKDEHTHTTLCTLTCGKSEHTVHTNACFGCGHVCDLSCYKAQYGDLERLTSKPEGVSTPSRNDIVVYEQGYNTRYYLYFNGAWYQCEYGSRYNITFVCPHTHSASCYTCEYHEHTASCVSCGKETHVHDSNCNQTGSGLDDKLWDFVKSDTITVNPNGSSVINVYYDRVEYTFTFKVSGTTVHSFSAKWGSNIRQKWTFRGTNGTNYSPENKDSWKGNVLYTERIYFVEIMPARDITFTRANGNTTSNTFHYYVESLPGATGDRVFEGKNYDWQFDLVNDFARLYYDEDFFELEGFTKYKSARENGTEYPLSNSGTTPINDLYFYYTRHKYAIEFYNPTELIKKTEGVPYESPLGSYNWTPDSSYAPSVYEPGSVAFGGWYLSPACTGDEYVLTDHTMPVGTKDGDTTLTLYAKWEPVTCEVNYYLSLDSLKRDEDIPAEMKRLVREAIAAGTITQAPANDPYTTVFASRTLSHGAYIGALNDPEVSKGYKEIHPKASLQFVGWFYLNDEGEETAFDPENMPVKRDLDLYGKWISNVLCPYEIRYILDANRNGIQDPDETTAVADSVTGSTLAGNSRTFYAKGDKDLYADYQEGYFPNVASHTIEFNALDEGGVVFTFLYKEAEKVPYTVKYLEKGTNNVLATEVTYPENKKAVVTENFKVIAGYMPDAYQKSIPVVPGQTNEIIFYYTVDTVHAPVHVVHYIQNVDGDGYTVYQESTDLNTVMGTDYSAGIQNIPGFTFDHATANDLAVEPSGGTVTANVPEYGLELKLYYNRETFNYKVQYLEYGTNAVLFGPVTRTDIRYNKTVTEQAIDIQKDLDGDGVVEDFQLYEPEKNPQSATIVDNNTVITFYYIRCTQTLTVTKTVVGAGTSADPNQKFAFTLQIHSNSGYHQDTYAYTKSGTNKQDWMAPEGSDKKLLKFRLKAGQTITIEGLPTAEYTVREVNVPENFIADIDAVTPGSQDYLEFTLTKTEQVNVTCVNTSRLGKLTITKTGAEAIDENQTFIFDVTAQNGFKITVTINGNGSVTIKDLVPGEYTVTERTDWSWRYTPDRNGEPITLVAGANNEVKFTNTRGIPYWLSGDNFIENQFTVKPKTQE